MITINIMGHIWQRLHFPLQNKPITSQTIKINLSTHCSLVGRSGAPTTPTSTLAGPKPRFPTGTNAASTRSAAQTPKRGCGRGSWRRNRRKSARTASSANLRVHGNAVTKRFRMILRVKCRCPNMDCIIRHITRSRPGASPCPLFIWIWSTCRELWGALCWELNQNWNYQYIIKVV